MLVSADIRREPTRVGISSKSRRLRCDCGRLAVTTIIVQVGYDPQYSITLPLCRACLALEQAMHNDG
jgi:hypothetical protein